MPGKKSGSKHKQGKKTQKRVAFNVPSFTEDWQLEAQVHTSLPPLVKGVLRGYLRVCVEGVVWDYSIGPPAPKLSVRLKWWGEQSPGTFFRVPVQMQTCANPPRRDCTTLAYYPVCSGWPQLQAYLKDMGSLAFQIGLGHMTDDSMVIGQAVITNLTGLSVTNPLKGQYPVVNTDGVCFGKLHIWVSLEMAKPSKVREKLARDEDKTGTHPEFVVGPGGRPSGGHPQLSSPEKDIDTIIGFLNSGERTAVSERKTLESDTKLPVRIPTTTEARKAGGGELSSKEDKISSSSTGQQIEVISELIARGRRLRDAMIHSMLEPQGTFPVREESTADKRASDHPPFSGDLPLVSMELTQNPTSLKSVHKEEAKRGAESSHNSKEKRRFGPTTDAEGLLPTTSGDQDIVKLVLGRAGEPELGLDGVYTELSSEEEEGGGRGMSDDFSMNESDYPLHSASLLHKLLYSDTGQMDTAVEHVDDVTPSLEDPGNMRSASIGRKPKSVDQPSTVPADCEAGPAQQSPPCNEDSHSTLSKTDSHSILPRTGSHSILPRTGSHSQLSKTGSHSRLSKSGSHSQDGGAVVSASSTLSKQADSHQRQTPETLFTELQPSRTDSLSTLSSFMGRHDKSLESAILSLIGMEKLTKLGRVSSARVRIERLHVDHSAIDSVYAIQRKKKAASKLPLPVQQSSANATYFVEYQFPAMISQSYPQGIKRPRPFSSQEIMRVASKKMQDGTVSFNHRSIFPAVFNSQVIRQWWSGSLVFRVYCRPPSERMPFLVGKAVVPLQRWLAAPSFNSQCHLDVRSSTLARGVSEDDPIVGKLEVFLQLVVGRKKGKVELAKQGPSTVEGEEVEEEEEEEEERRIDEKEGECQQTVKLKEKTLSPSGAVYSGPRPSPSCQFQLVQEVNGGPGTRLDLHGLLKLVLLIPEGMNIVTLPSLLRDPRSEHTNTGEVRGIPNCYLVCKLFCATPHPTTPVQWASSNPQFQFRQVYPLYLTPALLDKVCNNFAVVEVWHKTPGTTTEDELVGLVKLSLHQFYLAFSEQSSADLCLEAELPVTAVDCYCPIVNPFTGAEQGYLAVLLALGTSSQVSLLQQQVASGSYVLQRPHRSPRSRREAAKQESDGEVVPGGLHQAGVEERPEGNGGCVCYMFEVTVDGVRGLSVFSNTVWGEADCFVQYHFPTVSEGTTEDNEDFEVFLHPCRTGTTLCVPNPAFDYKTRHTLTLPQPCPLQRELMGACGSGGVPFELWRRFYYPNIRDQLVAKASLPLAKLCAMVTMQTMAGPNLQSFSLPLKLVSEDKKVESGGLLDITVKYEALSEAGAEVMEEEGHEKTHVNLSIGILRATGLKDAALLAANDHPVPLGFAAEAGVNTYAQISLPSLLHKEKRTTKTVARSFAPEYSHFFDLALPLVQVQGDRSHQTKGCKHAASKTDNRSSLAERLAKGLVILKIWHQVPRKGGQTGPVEASVYGRRLGPTFRDVLLGYVEVPLIQLLQKHTGIRGWFPLLAPVTPDDGGWESIQEVHPTTLPDTPPPLEEYVGGVELSISFPNKDDRQMILSSALKMGWKAPKGCSIDLLSLVPASPTGEEEMGAEDVGEGGRGGGGGEGTWRLDINVNSLSVPLDAVAMPLPTVKNPTYKYCFLRYRFMDNSPVVTVPRAVTYARDGTAYYQLKHRARLHTVASTQLKWYMNEEPLEIQVWGGVLYGGRRSAASGRPQAEDELLGLAYVPLVELLSHCSRSEALISGNYPIFKPGVDSLGSQALHVEIRNVVLERTERTEGAEVEILDTSMDEGESGDPTAARKEASPGEHATGVPAAEQSPLEKGEVFKDMFEARVVVHQALHLPLLTDHQQAEKEWPPSAYVTVHPHPNVEKITTPIVPSNQKPVWEYQCITHIPNHYLESQCPGLEFQVWSKPPDGEGYQLQNGHDSQPEREHSYFGCARVDLSPLAYGLSQITGWYNIADFGGQLQGQLKVTVIPSQRISFPSLMLSCPTHTSSVGRSSEFLGPQVQSSHHLHRHPATEGYALDHGTLPAQSDQLSAKTTSVLFRQLRENIQELDKIHESLKAKLRDSEDWSEPGDKQGHSLYTGVPLNRTSDLLISTTTGGGSQMGGAQAGTGKPLTSKQNLPATDTQTYTTAGDENEEVIQNPGNLDLVSTSHMPAPYHGHVEPLASLVPSNERSDHLFELLLGSQIPRGTLSRSNSPSVDEHSTDGSVSPVILPESSSVGSKSPDSSLVVSGHNDTFSLTDISASSLVLSQPADSQHPQFAHREEEEEIRPGDRPSEQAWEEGAPKLKQAAAESPEVSFEEESHAPKASESSQTYGGSLLESHYSMVPIGGDQAAGEVPGKVTSVHFADDDHEEKDGRPTGASVSLMLTSPPEGSTVMSTAPTMFERDRDFGGSSQQKDALLTSPSRHHRPPEGSTVMSTAPTMSGGGMITGGDYSGKNEAVPTKTHHRGHTQRMPTLVTPKVHLPNFFMPPHELEQSMRSLGACVLSRPPPRTHVTGHDPDKRTADRPVSTKQAFTTLQEVNQYLESRRTGDGAQTMELSASQTQRVARIFSSKPAHIH